MLLTLKVSNAHMRMALNSKWQWLNRDNTVELVLDLDSDINVYDCDQYIHTGLKNIKNNHKFQERRRYTWQTFSVLHEPTQ